MTLRMPLLILIESSPLLTRLAAPDDRSSVVRGPAAQADRGLSRGGAGLCRGEARPARPARGGACDGRASLPRRSGCRRRISPASCAGCAASAFARSCRTARSRSRREANRCARARPRGLPRKSRSSSGNIGGPGPMSSASLKTGKPAFEQMLRHARAPTGARRTPSKALCSTPIWPRRRWRKPGAIVAALDISGTKCLADIGGGYGGLLAALLGRPSAARSGAVRPPAHHRSRQALPAVARRRASA